MILVQYTYLSTGESGTFTEAQAAAADINGDGMIDSSDATLVLIYYSYISTEYDTLPIMEYLTETKYIKGIPSAADKK